MKLITARLLLREFHLSDLAAFNAHESNPKMHLFENGIPDEEKANSYLDWVIWKAGETPRTQFRLAVTGPPQGTVIGWIKLDRLNADIRE